MKWGIRPPGWSVHLRGSLLPELEPLTEQVLQELQHQLILRLCVPLKKPVMSKYHVHPAILNELKRLIIQE